MSTPPDATVPPSSFDGADSHSLAKCPYPSFTSLLSNPSKRISIPNLSSLSQKMSLLCKNHSHSQCTSMYHSFADSIHPPTPFAVHLKVAVVRIKCVTTNHPCLRPILMSPAPSAVNKQKALQNVLSILPINLTTTTWPQNSFVQL